VISNIHIKNYKSITNLTLEVGSVNVLIGENGAGKSNILEAIALAGAAAAHKLDNEFLSSRGIRVVRPVDMRPAFAGSDPSSPISVIVSEDNGGRAEFSIENDNKAYSKWAAKETGESGLTPLELLTRLRSIIKSIDENNLDRDAISQASALAKYAAEMTSEWTKSVEASTTKAEAGSVSRSIDLSRIETVPLPAALLKPEDLALRNTLGKFVTYSPENSALRTLQQEGQIEPLGIKGEGVSKLFSFYVSQADENSEVGEEASKHARSVLNSLDNALRMLGWFDGLRLAKETKEETLEVHDFYIDEKERYFEFGSANEGFFFLLFYFLLFSSDLTPPFFAVDNIDASLNPALCRALVMELVKLAKQNKKQVIFTTHNPAILDGLNLDDDDQRLFVVSRSLDGETRVERILKPRNFENLPHLKMSEAFMRGLIGGLSKTF
jgi:AAA15 family ATPase/GTPase